MKQIKLFDKTYNIVPDNGKWKENCPKCDLLEACDSFNRTLKKQLCDTPTGCIGYYHFELVNKENNMKYIPLDALVAMINKRKEAINPTNSHTMYVPNMDKFYRGWMNALSWVEKEIVNSLEAKEVGLPNFEQEVKDFCYSFDDRKEAWYNMTPHDQNLMVSPTFANFAMQLAKHFFELGMRVSNPITAADRGVAEEIIINLKRVENDYRLDLTKEIEWVRNQVKKENSYGKV